MIRAKFTCISKTGPEGPNPNGGEVVLQAVTGNTSEEDLKFFEATPSGELRMSVLNQQALDQFEEGQDYYLDITPAE